jgi:DNA-binding MarR family transcriptional regulator
MEAHMSDTAPTFDQQLIGQTEKTMNAILERLLAGSGISEPEWVTLVLTAAGGGSGEQDALTRRIAGGLKVDQPTAAAHIEALVGKGLLDSGPGTGDAAAVSLTDAGRRLIDGVRAHTGAVTQRLWGDLPEADLEVAARVLATLLTRAEDELAAIG